MSEILLRTTSFSQRAEPSPLWFGCCPKRRMGRGTTRISRVRCDKAKRGWASRVARVARRNGAPYGRGDGGESDPPFFPAGAPRAREKVSAKVSALCPPFGEVALTTVIPGGKASSASASSGASTSAPGCAPSSMKPSKNRRPQMARGREGQGWRMLTTQYLRSEPRGILPPRSTVSEAESRGLQHRKTCPPTSRKVQWIPVQIEGYNEGITTGRTTLSLL